MNAAGFPLLSLITWLPLVGCVVIMSVRGDEETVASNARWTALWTTMITFVVSLLLWQKFDKSEAGFQFVENLAWLPEYGVNYRMGVDGISVLFVLLSTALTPICILASWESITKNVREFMLAFLILETTMVGMFAAADFVVFYMFFEAVLIPMYLIIGVWGGPRRVYAAFKFFLYTLTGSVLMLIALLAMWRVAGGTDFMLLLKTPHTSRLRMMALTFVRLGRAAAFFFGSLAFFLVAPSVGGAPMASAASTCFRNSRRLGVLRAIITLFPAFSNVLRTAASPNDARL